MNTQTHDTQIFSAMVEILTQSGLGERDFGFTKNHHQTPYEELASMMNQVGFSNRAGNPLNRNALKHVVHRVRQKTDLIDELKPNWVQFRDTVYTLNTSPTFNRKTARVRQGVAVRFLIGEF